jgi:hypothetical protein
MIIGRVHNRFNNSDFYHVFTPYSFTQQTYSNGHRNWRNSDDGGGNFTSYLTEWTRACSQPVISEAIGGLTYFGAFAGQLPGGAIQPVGSGIAWGATAYNRMKPTKFDYSLFNMVYELKDLPGMLLNLQNFWDFSGFKKNWRRESGGRFLEQQFGWSPLVGDILTLIKKQQELQKRIDWLLRNQGKWVPRRVDLLDTRTVERSDWFENWDGLTPLLSSNFYRETPVSQISLERGDKIWACAQFKYFLPKALPGVKLNSVVRRAMSGIRPPSMADLYRAIPWTWLVDWCLGMASILENCDPGVADRIAARRFYIMRERHAYALQTSKAKLWGLGSQHVDVSCAAAISYTTKTRVVGSPFYPGNPNNLTGMQLGILGALGLSRY